MLPLDEFATIFFRSQHTTKMMMYSICSNIKQQNTIKPIFQTKTLAWDIPSLKLTFSPLKINGWKMYVLLGWPIFKIFSNTILVGFRECICRIFVLVFVYETGDHDVGPTTWTKVRFVALLSVSSAPGFPCRRANVSLDIPCVF